MFGRQKCRDPSLTWYPADDRERTRRIGGIVLAAVCAVTGFVAGTLSASVRSPRAPEQMAAVQTAPAPAPETPKQAVPANKQAVPAKTSASADVEQTAIATAGAMNAPPPGVAEKPAPAATTTAAAPSPEEKPATNNSAGSTAPVSPMLINPGTAGTDKSAKKTGPQRETRAARDRSSADSEASATREQRRERRARDRRPYPYYGEEEARPRSPGPPWGYGPPDPGPDGGRNYQSLRDLMLGR